MQLTVDMRSVLGPPLLAGGILRISHPWRGVSTLGNGDMSERSALEGRG